MSDREVSSMIWIVFILGALLGIGGYTTAVKHNVPQPAIQSKIFVLPIVIQNPPIVQPSGVYCIDDMVNNIATVSDAVINRNTITLPASITDELQAELNKYLKK